MADNHGNTPAAWTAVSVAFVGFLIGSIAMMLTPVNMTLLWVGIVVAAVALPLFMVMNRMGYHESGH